MSASDTSNIISISRIDRSCSCGWTPAPPRSETFSKHFPPPGLPRSSISLAPDLSKPCQLLSPLQFEISSGRIPCSALKPLIQFQFEFFSVAHPFQLFPALFQPKFLISLRLLTLLPSQLQFQLLFWTSSELLPGPVEMLQFQPISLTFVRIPPQPALQQFPWLY